MTDHAPWMRGGVMLTVEAKERLERDVLERYARSQEACGYLVGPVGAPLLCDEAVPMTNLADRLHALDPKLHFRTGKTSFAFREKDLEAAARRLAPLGRVIKVIYHSHLDQDAYLSATDAAVFSGGAGPSTMGGAAQVGSGPRFDTSFWVSSVRTVGGSPQVVAHRLYAWRGQAFEEATWAISG